MASQHADLTETRWRQFTLDQQILSIAAEMIRGRRRLLAGDCGNTRLGYERVLNLVDLTVAVNRSRGFRRELLRWREIVGALFITEPPSLVDHDAALRVLMTFSPAAFQQLPHVFVSKTQ